MILSLLRSVGSVVAGLVAAFILIIAAEVFSAIYHPFPPGVDTSDYEVCRAHVARYPTWVLAGGAAIWSAAPFIGAWLATRLGTARHPAHGIVVGALLLSLAAFNMAMLPYPIWFPVVIVLTFSLGTILGARLAKNPAIPPRAQR
jgi:hypothetical protein